MNKNRLDWLKISEKYKGLWIALNEEESEVIAAAQEAQAVYEEAQKKGVKTPILFRVPEEAVNYIGAF